MRRCCRRKGLEGGGLGESWRRIRVVSVRGAERERLVGEGLLPRGCRAALVALADLENGVDLTEGILLAGEEGSKSVRPLAS